MAKSVVIKDNYHSYIELDPLSTKLVDTPWLQRLKLVRQNDVSPFVYPTMQATRFEHSLGAMHLSKRCMESALRQPDADRFLAGLREELKALGYDCLEDKDLRTLSVQLAGLVGLLHDVGHPPLSHLIENCVGFQALYPEAKASEKLTKKWREYNGHQIIKEHLCSLFPAENDPVASATIEIAQVILTGLSEKPFLKSIHQLVDAVIDSDRMDFVLRDGGSSGSEFGRYDVNRIVQTFGFCFDDSSGKTEIYIRPSSKAQSAVESLLQERYKIYRWVHFHTRVLLAKAISALH